MGLSNGFLDMTDKAQSIKLKKKHMEIHQSKSSQQKKNNQQSEKTIYRIGKNICKPSI